MIKPHSFLIFFVAFACTYECAWTMQQRALLSGTLNAEIYDQTGLNFSEGKQINDKHVAVKRLYELKSHQYKEYVIDPLSKIINKLTLIKDKHKSEVDKAQKARIDLHKKAEEETESSFLGGLFRSVVSHVPVVGTWVNTTREENIRVAQQASAAARDYIKEPTEENLGALNLKINDLKEHRNKLLCALKADEVAPLEILYVVKKPFYPEKLQEKIEQAFVTARNRVDAPHEFRLFITRALSVPSRPLSIKEKDDSYYERFCSEEYKFRNYPPSVQKDLFKVVMDIAYASRSDPGSFPLRQTCYLYGNPGCGKTTAAEHIAEFLGLPYFRTNVRTIEDLSKESLEGKYGDELGWLTSALIEPVKKKSALQEKEEMKVSEDEESDDFSDDEIEDLIVKNLKHASKHSDPRGANLSTYSNGILIINDFDRILLDHDTQAAAIAFFLEYLDTDKKDFLSQYFDTKLDISRLSIIITGNNPIPSGDDPGAEGFKALLERLKIIKFEDMGNDVMKRIIHECVKECRSIFSYQFTGIEETDLIESIINKQKVEKLSIRRVKAEIKEKILDLKLKSRSFSPVKDKKGVKRKKGDDK